MTSNVVNQIERACTDLASNGRQITFTAVAARTGMARSTLYRNQALRAVIEHHAAPNTTGRSPPSPTNSRPCEPPWKPSPTKSAPTTIRSADSPATDRVIRPTPEKTAD